ncbi:uncharacterized protein LOC124369474 [Homalodisca vitripennis]|uniref:uncharacterized protein LOC124369474 n=1 Tax=Homalodisca vitripennis TaxID=197043 RepID=UPI001EEB1C0D|nr:uncharacterized protein LOC124369474 [Homalodisca vitripennis]
MFVTTSEPTRGDRCLDSIVTNLDSWNYSVRVTEPCIADHSAVILMTNLEEHGFRRRRSTTTAVMDLVDKIKTAFEDRNFALLALCDLSKAFDCIRHKILLNKLEQYGASDVVIDTFKSYFSGKQQVLSVHEIRERSFPPFVPTHV